jgi:hypothetical protein
MMRVPVKFVKAALWKLWPTTLICPTPLSRTFYNLATDNNTEIDKDLLLSVMEALNFRENSVSGPDALLLDRVIEILQLPFSEGYLNSNALTELRELLLTPDELRMTRFNEAKAFRCYKCQDPFVQSQKITITRNHENRYHLWCDRCRPAALSMCQYIGCFVKIPSEGRFCNEHRPTSADPKRKKVKTTYTSALKDIHFPHPPIFDLFIEEPDNLVEVPEDDA